MFKTLKFVLAASAVATLAACGGGGGGGAPAATGPVASTLTFPVAAGARANTASGLSKNFTVTGSCTGTGTRTSTAANTVATFEGVTGFSSTTTLTINVASPCTSVAQTSTSYFDTNYNPLGFNSVGVNYGVYATAPVLPASVTVGSTAVIGTQNLYTDSTKTVSNGTISQSYVVTADTATTAIVNLISKIYTAGGTLSATEQDLFRINAAGTFTPISVDLLYSNGTRLVFTYN